MEIYGKYIESRRNHNLTNNRSFCFGCFFMLVKALYKSS